MVVVVVVVAVVAQPSLHRGMQPALCTQRLPLTPPTRTRIDVPDEHDVEVLARVAIGGHGRLLGAHSDSVVKVIYQLRCVHLIGWY